MQGTYGATPGGGDLRSSTRAVAARDAFVAKIEMEGDRVVLLLAGEFDHADVEAAEAAMARALGQSASGRVIIDLRELTFIDSTGIAFLVQAWHDCGPCLTIHESRSSEVRRLLALVGIPDFAIGAGASLDGDR